MKVEMTRSALKLKHPWPYGLWIPLFGLVIWSYGFNNIPFVRPLPLVDVLVGFAIVFSLPRWGVLRHFRVSRSLLVLLSWLLIVVLFRLVVDIPRFGLLAARDALFAFELWTIFPAIVVGFRIGEQRFNRVLWWLFGLAMAWYLLYPWREWLAAVGPVVGIQRPLPLFAFTTAGFIAVPAFFFFIYRKNFLGFVGATASLIVLFLVQSRGAYLAFLASILVLLLLRPSTTIRKFWKLGAAGIVVMLALGIAGNSITGRVGAPVGIDSAIAQLNTLLGKEGPGAGSFHHRLVAWPWVVNQVLSQPLGPIFGLGLGPDLFQGFVVGPGVLVRKPHNDLLEIWARLGIFGLLPWLGFLVILGREALKGTRQHARHGWVLALQLILWITSLSQPAMGFAYITVTWTGLTGLWLGTQLRERIQSQNAYLASTQPLPPTRR